MVKKTLMVVAMVTSSLHADWVDDLAQVVGEKGSCNVSQLLKEVEKHIDADKKTIERLKKQSAADKKDPSVMKHARNGANFVEIKTTTASLNYLEKVARSIQEMADNKKERERFIEHLRSIHHYRKELLQLKKDYEKANGMGETVKDAALIATKEAQLRSSKALLKSSFFFSAA